MAHDKPYWVSSEISELISVGAHNVIEYRGIYIRKYNFPHRSKAAYMYYLPFDYTNYAFDDLESAKKQIDEEFDDAYSGRWYVMKGQRIKQINNLVIRYTKDYQYSVWKPVYEYGAWKLDKKCCKHKMTLEQAEEFCRNTKDFTRRQRIYAYGK